MMPLFTPIAIPAQPDTEYRKERAAYETMQVELRQRKAADRKAAGLARFAAIFARAHMARGQSPQTRCAS